MNLLQNHTTRENATETISKLFKLLNVKVTEATLEEGLHNHPDYPSMLSISDVLTSFGVENISLKISAEQLAQMPMPCIAPIKINKYDEKFAIIKSVTEGVISYLNPASLRSEDISFVDFAEKWPTGILMLIDAETAKEEEGYLDKKLEERTRGLLMFGTYAVFPVLMLLAIGSAVLGSGTIALLPALYIILMLTGLVSSGLLLWYEIDEHNPALKQICKAGTKANCSAILASRASKVAGIGWSSIGFVYFFGGVIFLLILGILNSDAQAIMGWLSIFALPYILFSIYYQWRVAKQWCILCLTVQGVLALQGIIVLLPGWVIGASFTDIIKTDILVPLIVLYLIPSIALSVTLPALRVSKTSKQQQKELQKVKHNPQIFQALLVKQKELTESTADLGITLGNPDALYKIIKVCNPYCGPCSKAHVPIEEILRNNPDVQVQIIFTASNDENDRSGAPVRHLLAIQEKHGEEIIKRALADWYLAPRKDYDVFSDKYTMNGELAKQDSKIKSMRQWCDKTNITFTPTFFVNGHQLPEMYGVNDLKYFLSV